MKAVAAEIIAGLGSFVRHPGSINFAHALFPFSLCPTLDNTASALLGERLVQMSNSGSC
ncbi:MAG: hypothetical protein IIB43_07655 [Candidatus Marinimicrobia bacterium]|nr:hypothetical protein [Candidatus Neomarinimicrobiota bacterium]